MHTCAKEEHLVNAVGSHNLVHGHRCVFVVSVGTNHQGSPPHRVDGIEHDRMVSHKGHHVVGELLCCLNVRREGSTGALEKQTGVCALCKKSFIHGPIIYILSIPIWKLSSHWQNTVHIFCGIVCTVVYILVIRITDNNMYSLLIKYWVPQECKVGSCLVKMTIHMNFVLELCTKITSKWIIWPKNELTVPGLG